MPLSVSAHLSAAGDLIATCCLSDCAGSYIWCTYDAINPVHQVLQAINTIFTLVGGKSLSVNQLKYAVHVMEP